MVSVHRTPDKAKYRGSCYILPINILTDTVMTADRHIKDETWQITSKVEDIYKITTDLRLDNNAYKKGKYLQMEDECYSRIVLKAVTPARSIVEAFNKISYDKTGMGLPGASTVQVYSG